jgi:D-tyrosyl-tRNA(Tyr) deacylase
MRVIVQRVKHASVTVNNEVVGKIGHGLLLYVCLENNDNETILQEMAKKIINLRIFEDENNKMNKNISQVEGSILSVSQFTLAWKGKGGNRPSFEDAMSPVQAKIYYATFNNLLRASVPQVENGIFGGEMLVDSLNDGPVTFIINVPCTFCFAPAKQKVHGTL